jgi:hypothetical protein
VAGRRAASKMERSGRGRKDKDGKRETNRKRETFRG